MKLYISFCVLAMTLPIHATELDDYYKLCRTHMKAPIRGPAFEYADGWERCKDVEALWEQEHSTQKEDADKAAIDSFINKAAPK